MKTFDDLQFKNHPIGSGEQARLDFENGYGVSVLSGCMWYSNGIDTYELAVCKHGKLCFSTEIADDVLGYISKDEVTDTMRKIQELPCSTQD